MMLRLSSENNHKKYGTKVIEDPHKKDKVRAKNQNPPKGFAFNRKTNFQVASREKIHEK